MNNQEQRKAGNIWICIAVILIAVLGAWLRVHALGRPLLWIDEITVVDFAEGDGRTVGAIVGDIYKARLNGTTGQHMPFQYAWLNVFLHLYQHLDMEANAAAVRFPFVLLGILTIPLLYGTVRRCYGRQTGLWAMFLMAISFFHVYQSRDATSYAPLLFFLALNLLGLVGLTVRPDAQRWRRLVWAVCFFLGAIGAFASHLSAWLFLGAEGLLLVAFVIRIALRRDEQAKAGNYFAPAAFLFTPILLLGVSCLPFATFILSVMQGGGIEETARITPFSSELVVYQFAHFGWGKGGGRLISYLVLLGCGLYSAFKPKERRGTAFFHAGLLIIPPFLFFMVLQRNYFPRYLSIVYIPSVVFVALGASWLCDRLARLVRVPERWHAGVHILLAIILLLWMVGPFRTMYAMRDKLMPISYIRDWIEEKVPDGGLFVWKNGYHMREIPGTHQVGRRYAAFADHPNAGIPEQELVRRSRNGQAIHRNHPTAPWVADAQLNEPLWTWIHSGFKHQEPLYDDVLHKLWRQGLSPHGHEVRQSTQFVGYYTDESDIEKALHGRDQMLAWPGMTGWRYIQTQTGELFYMPQPEGHIKVLNDLGAGSYRMIILGVAVESGALFGRVEDATGVREMPTLGFQASNPIQLEWGPIVLEKGPSEIIISQNPADRMALLIHSIQLVPEQAEQ